MLFSFSLPGPSRYWTLLGSEQPQQMNGKDCLLSCAGIAIFWGPLEERSSLRRSVRAGFWHGFFGLWEAFGEFGLRLLKISTTATLCPVCLVAQLCLMFCNPIDGSAPGSPVPGILQARMLERVAVSFCRGSSWLRSWTHVSCFGGGLVTKSCPTLVSPVAC